MARLAIYAVCIAGIVQFSFALVDELSGAITSDATVYFTIGRGILNGLTPYVDLFDYRPPGIFYISAFSLLTSGSFTTAHILEACILLLFPVAGVFVAERKLNGLLFGALLGIFTFANAGNIQTESFGALFACGYVVASMYIFPKKTYVQALCITGAVLLKEPFALTLIATSLIIHQTKEEWIHEAIIPTAIGIVFWCLFMAITGTFTAYFSMYLPITFGIKVDNNLLHQAIKIHQVLLNAWQFSPGWLATICILFIGNWLVRPRIITAIRYVAVTLLMTAGIGAAGTFYAQHFVLAAPVFLALFWRLQQQNSPVTKNLLLGAIGLSFFYITPPDIRFSHPWQQEQQAARQLDTIMDDCGIDRYVHLQNIGSAIPALMTHSPFGPPFFVSVYTGVVPEFVDDYVNNVERTTMILAQPPSKISTKEKPIYAAVQPDIYAHFMSNSPPCAKFNGESIVFDEYNVLFRAY